MKIEEAIPAAHILVVDEQPASLEVLTRLLAEAGYTNVSATTNPCEASILHRRRPCELVLLDLPVPSPDRLGVMQSLQADEGDPCPPVIVLTQEPAHKLRALQAGAKDFINKPLDLVELRTRIHNTLELRLLYRRLDESIERTVAERTAELRHSEARYRGLTELAADWYWEQDEHGAFTQVAGPVMDILGLRAGVTQPNGADEGWDPIERQILQAYIEARRPFLDFALHRLRRDGRRLTYRVSGQPVFDRSCRFTGYRGVGVEVPADQ